jgi:UMP-CMP kinase
MGVTGRGIDQSPETNLKKPIFKREKVTVVFVLGGPGAGVSLSFLPAFALSPDSAMPSSTYMSLGKGTQCDRLVEKYDFCHLSTGDLLRAEQEDPNSQDGGLIRTLIQEGKLVPLAVTIKLVENAMRAALQLKSGASWANGKGRFLIDGFPREMDQALRFEEDVRSQPPRLRF